MYIKHALLMNVGRNKTIGRNSEKHFTSKELLLILKFTTSNGSNLLLILRNFCLKLYSGLISTSDDKLEFLNLELSSLD